MPSDFPTNEAFKDCAGTLRNFKIEVRHLTDHGYAAEAREATSAEHGGYVFRTFAEASAMLALARLRIKVRQGLAQRFLIREGGSLEMPFERLRGRIDAEGVVVDGALLTWDDFIELIQVSQGFEFELHIPLEPSW